jgi:hypothetical protein
MLRAFTTPRRVARAVPGWQPRELTGLGDEEADDE